jgi:hypothetical protein
MFIGPAADIVSGAAASFFTDAFWVHTMLGALNSAEGLLLNYQPLLQINVLQSTVGLRLFAGCILQVREQIAVHLFKPITREF